MERNASTIKDLVFRSRATLDGEKVKLLDEVISRRFGTIKNGEAKVTEDILSYRFEPIANGETSVKHEVSSRTRFKASGCTETQIYLGAIHITARELGAESDPGRNPYK